MRRSRSAGPGAAGSSVRLPSGAMWTRQTMHHGALMELEETLTRQARDYYGDNARVDRLLTPPGGPPGDVYGFDVVAGAARHELVLRADPPGLADPEGRARELAALRVAS